MMNCIPPNVFRDVCRRIFLATCNSLGVVVALAVQLIEFSLREAIFKKEWAPAAGTSAYASLADLSLGEDSFVLYFSLGFADAGLAQPAGEAGQGAPGTRTSCP